MIQIQPLEARQLLSATVPAAKTKPTIPNIVGVFNGTETEQKPTAGSAESLTITITSQSTKGVVAGTVAGTLPSVGSTSEALTGKVNTKGHVVIKFATSTKAKGSAVGTFNSTTGVFTGKYSTPASKGHKSTHGIFSVTKAVL